MYALNTEPLNCFIKQTNKQTKLMRVSVLKILDSVMKQLKEFIDNSPTLYDDLYTVGPSLNIYSERIV